MNAQQKNVDPHLVGSAKKLVLLVSRKAGGGDAKSTIKRAALNGEKAKYVAKETETWEKDNKHFIEKANQKRKEMDDFIQQKKSDPKEFFADFHGTAGDMEEAAKKYAAQEKKQEMQVNLTKGSNLDNLFNRLGSLYSETQRQIKSQNNKIAKNDTESVARKPPVAIPQQQRTLERKEVSPVTSHKLQALTTSPIASPSEPLNKTNMDSPERRIGVDAGSQRDITPLPKIKTSRANTSRSDYSSLLDDLLSFGDETSANEGKPYLPKTIDFEKGYEEYMKNETINRQHKDSPVKSHSSLKLALSGRYTDGKFIWYVCTLYH